VVHRPTTIAAGALALALVGGGAALAVDAGVFGPATSGEPTPVVSDAGPDGALPVPFETTGEESPDDSDGDSEEDDDDD
jgi:hypothetical protein